MRWLAAILVLGGCDLIFKLDGSSVDPPADAAADGPSRPVDPPGCSAMSMLADDFDVGMGGAGTPFPRRPWSLFKNPSTAMHTALETPNVLIGITDGTIEVVAEPYLDLREHRVSVELARTMGLVADENHHLLNLQSRDGRHRMMFGLLVEGLAVNLVAGYFVTDDNQMTVFNRLGGKLYNGTDHRFLAVERIGGTTRFLAGATIDALVEEFTDSTTQFDWVDFVRPSMSMNATGTQFFVIDAFNGGGAPSGFACPANNLFEPFTDGVISVEWLPFVQNCDVVIDGSGSLRWALGSQPESGACGLTNATYRDLRGQSVAVGVESVLVTPDSAWVFTVETRTDAAGFSIAPDGTGGLDLVAALGASGSIRRTEAYDPQAHRFLRFTGTVDDHLIWEVSADGETYQAFAQTSFAGEIGAVDVTRFNIALTGMGGTDTGSSSLGGINAL